MDLLPTRWLATWAALNLAPPTGLCEQLLCAWDEPQRHYHTLQHLAECLTMFDTLRAHAGQPADIELALWFHDAIYDVQGHDNEARSAHWARPPRALPNTRARSEPNTRGCHQRCTQSSAAPCCKAFSTANRFTPPQPSRSALSSKPETIWPRPFHRSE
jgi:hypothetical protein